jgi:hypothetical protein
MRMWARHALILALAKGTPEVHRKWIPLTNGK